jgi:acyl dehydratase
MKFAEFHVGQVLTFGPRSLEREEIIAFASRWDPQWFHVDPVAAKCGRFQGLIASGWQTCSLAMRMICEAALHGSEAFASPGLSYVKWPHPVRCDEPLRLHADVLEVRISRRQPQLGIVRWRWRLLHADGREALDLEATSLFDVAGENQGAPVRPASQACER